LGSSDFFMGEDKKCYLLICSYDSIIRHGN